MCADIKESHLSWVEPGMIQHKQVKMSLRYSAHTGVGMKRFDLVRHLVKARQCNACASRVNH